MSDVNYSAPESSAFTPAEDDSLTFTQAMAELAEKRYPDDATVEREAPDAPEMELSDEDNIGPDESQTPDQETDGEDGPEFETPSIDPPRSWTKEEKEAFKALPPEHQKRISDRERARDVEIRTRQNELAEQRKVVEAERQKYEQALPIQMQMLQAQMAGEFADIKTLDDAQRIAAEDPLRYLQWDAAQKRIQAVQQEVVGAQKRQEIEAQNAFAKYAEEQDRAFIAKAPEFADPAKRDRAVLQAQSYLESVGLTAEEIAASYNGQRGISLRDSRVMSIIRDGMRFRAAQEAAQKAAAAPKSLPPVQKPGVTTSKSERNDERIESLSRKLDATGDFKTAMELLANRRRA